MGNVVDSNFIGDFKLGDNIIHNLSILEVLYSQFDDGSGVEKNLLCKPIIILLVSISEAVIFDLNYRVRKFTSEGVDNISHADASKIRAKKLKKYRHHIDCAQEFALFGSDSDLYDFLKLLAQLRNRVHIQNVYNDFESDEYEAFNEKRKKRAEKTTEFLAKYSAKFYLRKKQHKHVDDFILPWKAHFADVDIVK